MKTLRKIIGYISILIGLLVIYLIIATAIAYIPVNKDQSLQLCSFILNQFDIDKNELQLIDTDQNYGANDVFYNAKGTYNLFYTCNTWANNALKAAGLKACLFTLWDKGIFYHYKNPHHKNLNP